MTEEPKSFNDRLVVLYKEITDKIKTLENMIPEIQPFSSSLLEEKQKAWRLKEGEMYQNIILAIRRLEEAQDRIGRVVTIIKKGKCR